MLNREMKRLLLATLMVLPMAASADDAPPNYVGGMFSYDLPDRNSAAERGLGGHFLYGSPVNSWLSLELNGFGHQLQAGSGFTGEASAFGVGLDARGMALQLPYLGLFGIGGVGMSYQDSANTGNKLVAPYLNVGTGLIVPITSNLSARAEARYYLTASSQIIPGQSFANDGHFNVGLEYSFEDHMPTPAPVLPPPAPEPVRVVPPADQDNDGVADSADVCPDTPAGTVVDERGCPVRVADSDGDGVPDDGDKCPNTTKGLKVDDTGCVVKQVLVLHNINFATDSGELTADSKKILDGLAEGMKGQPAMTVEIDGHTDSTGSQAHNLKLSKLRAGMVRQYLATQGVALERMTEVGFGEERPIATNKTVEGRALNRRVEFKIKN